MNRNNLEEYRERLRRDELYEVWKSTTAGDSFGQADLETSCRGFLPTMGHHCIIMMMVVVNSKYNLKNRTILVTCPISWRQTACLWRIEWISKRRHMTANVMRFVPNILFHVYTNTPGYLLIYLFPFHPKKQVTFHKQLRLLQCNCNSFTSFGDIANSALIS